MKNKDIKPYLPYYIGQTCVYTEKALLPGERFVLTIGCLFSVISNLDSFNLELRKLSSMTEEEAKEIWFATGGRYAVTNPKAVFTSLAHENYTSPPEWFDITRHLLSKGFDLFGLIDSGLAIEKK